MELTKQQLIQISGAWGELAFNALEVLEKTGFDLERASKEGVPIPEKITAARKRAETDLDAALYAAPAIAKAIGALPRRAG